MVFSFLVPIFSYDMVARFVVVVPGTPAFHLLYVPCLTHNLYVSRINK